MSSMAISNLQSAFPQPRPISDDKHFSYQINTALKLYNDNYTNYLAKLPDMDKEARHWRLEKGPIEKKEKKKDEFDSRFREGLDTFINFQKIFIDVNKINETFEATMKHCYPNNEPPKNFTSKVVEDIQKLGIDPTSIKDKFDEVLTANHKKMQTCSEKMKKLYDEIKPLMDSLESDLNSVAKIWIDYRGLRMPYEDSYLQMAYKKIDAEKAKPAEKAKA